MKLDFSQANVQQMVGMGEAKTSQMLASPLAFDILSKRIYRDKVKAPIQELSCNAKDAHTMVGTPTRPIEVKLPNALDAEFYVKDWGPGLSREQVFNLYMTYFMSTKSESDDFTGAFGLGSKSPFSYTDQFFITSAQGGIQTTYLAFRDNTGMPSISEVENSTKASPADWPHGLRVGFPVIEADFKRFSQAAAEVFQWFDVAPDVKGQYETPVNSRLIEQPEFSVRSASNIPGKTMHVQSFVKMGSVGYKVELDSIGNQLSGPQKSLLTGGIVLNLAIGQVAVTASRESLEYEPRTIEALRDKLNFVNRALVAMAVEAIGLDPKERLLNDVIEKLIPLRTLINRIGVASEWAIAFVRDVHSVFEEKTPGVTSVQQIEDFLNGQSIKLPSWVGSSNHLKIATYQKAHKGYTQKTLWGGKIGTSEVTLSLIGAPLAIVIDDVSYASHRCKHALTDKALGGILFISGKDKKIVKEMAEKISAHFCRMTILNASDMEKGWEPVRYQGPRAPRGTKATLVGRVAAADRLKHYANEKVVLRTGSGREILPLGEAMKRTSAFLFTNFTSDYVLNKVTVRAMDFPTLSRILAGLPHLHENFVSENLDCVMLLNTAQIQKFKAETYLRKWEHAVNKVFAENLSEIEEKILSNPGFLPEALYHSDIRETKMAKDKVPQIVEHFAGMLHSNELDKVDSISKTSESFKFVEALVPDLKELIQKAGAAIGRVFNAQNDAMVASPSLKAWRPLYALAAFYSLNQHADGAGVGEFEDSVDFANLLKKATWYRDQAFYDKVESMSLIFEVIKEGNSLFYHKEIKGLEIAQVYNALWALAKAKAIPNLKLAA